MKRILTQDSRVLVTGVTGLVGGEVFRHLLARGHRGRISALIRPTDESPARRIQARLERSGHRAGAPDNVRPVAGDILQPNWALGADDMLDVVGATDMIFHNAADTSFTDASDSGTTNVESVRNLIGLVKKCPSPPLIVYMSTASNVGDVADATVTEADGCRPDNRHFNAYTRSKAVAEQLLRDSGLPVLTLRPTIVLSEGLDDAKFARQILWCVPITRVFRALPVNPAARLDIVDVDFVAEATLRLAAKPERRFDCYHLSAGAADAQTISELSAAVGSFYGRRTPLATVPPALWTRPLLREALKEPVGRRIYRSLMYYFPFLNMNVVYDRTRLEQELGAACPAVKRVSDYMPRLLKLIGTKAAFKEAMVP